MINLEIMILIVLFIASLILIFSNTKLSIFVLILLSVSLHKEFFSIYKWDVLPVRIFMLAFSLYILFFAIKSIKRKVFFQQIKNFISDPFIFLLLGLLLFRSISLINSKNLFSSISLLGFFGTAVIFGIFLYKKFSNEPDKILSHIKFYIFLVFGLCLFAFAQLFVYLKFGFIFGALWNVPGHLPRLGATFWDVNHFAGLLASILPILGILILVSKKFSHKITYFFMFIPMLATLALTNSRSAWILAFVSFFVFVVLFLVQNIGKKGLLLALFGLTLVVSPLIYEYHIKSSPFRASVRQYLHYRIDSFDSHFLLLRGALQVFEKYPYIGGGYGSFFEQFSKTKVAPEYFGRDPAGLNVRVPAHTIWGEVFAETGIIGFSLFLLFFLFIIFSMIYISFKVSDKREKLLIMSMASSVVGFAVAGIFYSYNSEFFWLILFFYFLYALGRYGGKINLNELLSKFLGSESLSLTLVLLLSLVLLFTALGKNHFIPWDEAIYAKVSKNILTTNEYGVLKWFGNDPWFEKPPLYFWISTLFMKLVGITELGSRLLSAVSGFFTVLLVYLIGKKMFNKRVGFVSAFILITTSQFLYYSRLGMLDVTLSFFITLSLYFYLISWQKRSPVYWILSGISFGLAVMTKNMIGLLSPAIIFSFESYLLISKNKKLSAGTFVNYFLYLVGGLLIFMPWHIYMFQKFGNDFIQNYLGYHVLTRATTGIEDKGLPFFWYLTVLKVSMRIWFIALLGAIPYGLYRIFKEKSKNYIFLFIWILLVFVLFSISKSKLVWYIIPIYPALALLTGHFIDDAINIVLSKIKVGRVILKFLLYFLLIDFGLFYLFLVRGLAYPADLTEPQANLLQRKEKEFGYVEKLYADRIELPLILYYQNGPFEIVDFGPLKRKLANAGYKGRLIFITKESRFNGFLKVYPRLSLVEQDKEWVLAILPSVYELDIKALSGVQGEIAGIEDKIKTDAKDGKVTKAKIVERLFYLRDENLRISKKIDIGLKSDL